MNYKAPYTDMSVLVVDDEKNIRILVARIATNLGYKTTECDSAEKALVLLKEQHFNIIITDIKMGKTDGIALADYVRRRLPEAAVIIMTGYPSSKTAKQSRKLGAINYLQKPLSMEELSETLLIAATWNISKLCDAAIKKLRKHLSQGTSPADQQKVMKLILQRELRLLSSIKYLAQIVYEPYNESNPLLAELKNKSREQ